MQWETNPPVNGLTQADLKKTLAEELKRFTGKMVTRAIVHEELQSLAREVLPEAMKDVMAELREQMTEDLSKLLLERSNMSRLEADQDDAALRAIGRKGFRKAKTRQSMAFSEPAMLRKTTKSTRESVAARDMKLDAKEEMVTTDEAAVTTAQDRHAKFQGSRTASKLSVAEADAYLPAEDTTHFGPLVNTAPERPFSKDDEERQIRVALLERRRMSTAPGEDDTPWQAKARRIVDNKYFEYAAGIVVLLNALALGFDTDFRASHHGKGTGAWPSIFDACETCFCIAFSIELAFRIFVHRDLFFTMEGWHWNALDTVLVGLQLTDQLARFFIHNTKVFNVGVMRSLRILRLIRITRAIRIFKLFDNLHTIVASMTSSAASLFWAVIIMLLTIYIFGVLFMQIILNCSQDFKHAPALVHWFGSLGRTTLTMFECIIGGVSWDDVVSPLMTEIGPWMGVGFVVYIGISLFTLLNCITSVFVEKVTKTVREDKDADLGNRLWNLFTSDDETQEGVTWETFKYKVDTRTMRDFFLSIDVDPADAKDLFALLDVDRSGYVDTEEMIHGCMKMRGPAKALEVMLLSRSVHDFRAHMNSHSLFMEHQVLAVLKKLQEAETKALEAHPSSSSKHEPRSGSAENNASFKDLLLASEDRVPSKGHSGDPNKGHNEAGVPSK